MSNASASASSVAPTIAITGVVRLPNYELLRTSLLKGIEDAAMATITSSSVEGDLFNSNRAEKMPIGEVSEDAVILVPLFSTTDSVAMNSDLLALGPMVYIRLDGPPQPRSIFGTCVAYSEGAVIREVELGTKVRFPPPQYLLVAKPSLIDLVDDVAGIAVDNPRNGEARPVKRLRTRLLEDVGELTENREEKGMNKYLLDLDYYVQQQ